MQFDKYDLVPAMVEEELNKTCKLRIIIYFNFDNGELIWLKKNLKEQNRTSTLVL